MGWGNRWCGRSMCLVTGSTVIAMVLLLALLGGMFWIDTRLLTDLASTPDGDLRMFTRTGWRLLIVFSFPIGPFLYLLYAKPRP
jgi:hypothetical protein